eukprot:TRINITY_DN7914_c0_g1_i9.p1 TRINITY_DN7914_c0_g1~~TRINITY_DN7914_c0_g1_i9.p1  ORF type:complete len:206 (-),score=44.12 TRINITY_DN7914_c0_g1_i9:174-791(-)
MTSYTLQMSGDDCGGLQEYSDFFTASRKVFVIDQQRQELSSELREVLAIMESNYDEETQKFKKIEKLNDSLSERRRLMWDLTLSVISLFSIPYLTVSSIFGMNNDDLPDDISWYRLMAICGATSAALLFVFGLIVYFFIIRPTFQTRKLFRTRVEEELNVKLSEERLVEEVPMLSASIRMSGGGTDRFGIKTAEEIWPMKESFLC